MSISFRQANHYDAAIVASIHCQSWRETYSGLLPHEIIESWANLAARTQSWVNTFAQGHQHVWLAFVNETPVGYASFGASPLNALKDDELQTDQLATHTGQLFGLYLLDSAKRMGLGKQLVKRAINDLKAAGHTLVRVEVLQANTSAIAFYKALGAYPLREAQFEVSGTQLATYVLGWDDSQ